MLDWKTPQLSHGSFVQSPLSKLSAGATPSWKCPLLPSTQNKIPTGLNCKAGSKSDLPKKSSWTHIPLPRVGRIGAPAGRHSLRGSWKRPLLIMDPDAELGQAVKRPRHVPPGQQQRNTVRVCPATLSLLVDTAAVPPPQTQYAQNGCSRDRMQSVLIKKKSCCSKGCSRLFTLPEVSQVCDLWHALSPRQQAQYLCSQHESLDLAPDQDGCAQLSKRTDWILCGKGVSFSCLCSLLGVGEHSMYKKLRHEVDMRKTWGDSHTRPQRRQASNLVDLFFMELYHGSSEDLPENDTHFEGDTAFAAGKEIEPPADIFGWTPEAAMSERAAHFISPSPSVPRRHLSPGGLAALFWQFKAWWRALEEHQHNTVQEGSGRVQQECPSWPTFWRRWAQTWTNFLQFRKTSQHKECNACFDFREALHKKRDRKSVV